MLPKINPDIPPFNGQSHDVEYLNLQLQRFVAHSRTIVISGENGTGKYRAARWLHLFRTGNEDLIKVELLTEANIAQLHQYTKGIYIFMDEAFASQSLTQILALSIPLMYIGITSTKYFKVDTQIDHIHIPPLRERVLDIPIITQILLHQLAKETGKAVPSIHETELQHLQRMLLLGNVKELKEVLRGMMWR